MSILRLILAIVVGYVLFASASMMFVVHAMGNPEPPKILFCLVSLVQVGLIAGFVSAFIAGAKARPASYILAGLVALATLANLLMQLGAEPAWYKISTLLLTVPVILLTGHYYREVKKRIGQLLKSK